MRDALRSQRCEDRKVPVGGFAKHGVKPLPGFDDVLNGAILVIRRELDTVPRRSDLDALSTPPNACRSTEFWMERANMRCGAGYRNPERSELLAEHFKKAAGIGRETPLLGYPAKKFGLATGNRGIEIVCHSSAEISQRVTTATNSNVV